MKNLLVGCTLGFALTVILLFALFALFAGPASPPYSAYSDFNIANQLSLYFAGVSMTKPLISWNGPCRTCQG